MIQLIGFLLCIYVLVRGLDIKSRIEDRKAPGSVSAARWAGNIAIVAAIIFFILFIIQGNSMPSPPSSL
jgi:hypothetical protein